jgi:glycosyltransferase involved in cell wall biosynthesis
MLSILLPVNCHSPYFLSTIKSLAKASAKLDYRTELVIVLNKVSETESSRIKKDLEFYPFSKKVMFTNASNLAQVLNEGLSECAFEYVARMDADDICHESRFIEQLYLLRNNPNIVLVGGQVVLIDAQSKPVGIANYPTKVHAIKRRLGYGNCFAHPAVMFRKTTILGIGGYRNIFPFAEDYDLWVRLGETRSLSNLPTFVIDYRIHSSQVSTSKFIIQLCSTIQIMALKANLLDSNLISQLNSISENSNSNVTKSILGISYFKNHRKFRANVALMIARRGSLYTQNTFLENISLLLVALASAPIFSILEIIRAILYKLIKMFQNPINVH